MRARIQQFINAWKSTRELDPRLIPWVAGGATVTFAAFFALGWWLFGPVIGAVSGVVFALLVGMIVFGRRAQSAQIAEIEGVPGAAAAVLQQMRGQWFVTPVVAVTRKKDLVHRVVGRSGVILVGEGTSARVTQLLDQERKKMERAVSEDVPVHTLLVGEDEDAVELGKLQVEVGKFKHVLGKREVPKLERRLKPLDKSNIPIPKGYIGQQGKNLRR